MIQFEAEEKETADSLSSKKKKTSEMKSWLLMTSYRKLFPCTLHTAFFPGADTPKGLYLFRLPSVMYEKSIFKKSIK